MPVPDILLVGIESINCCYINHSIKFTSSTYCCQVPGLAIGQIGVIVWRRSLSWELAIAVCCSWSFGRNIHHRVIIVNPRVTFQEELDQLEQMT
jgi:hypothetical protein